MFLRFVENLDINKICKLEPFSVPTRDINDIINDIGKRIVLNINDIRKRIEFRCNVHLGCYVFFVDDVLRDSVKISPTQHVITIV